MSWYTQKHTTHTNTLLSLTSLSFIPRYTYDTISYPLSLSLLIYLFLFVTHIQKSSYLVLCLIYTLCMTLYAQCFSTFLLQTNSLIHSLCFSLNLCTHSYPFPLSHCLFQRSSIVKCTQPLSPSLSETFPNAKGSSSGLLMCLKWLSKDPISRKCFFLFQFRRLLFRTKTDTGGTEFDSFFVVVFGGGKLTNKF